MIIPVNSGGNNFRTILTEMQSSGELCDFSIKSGVHSVQAHKCVLAATLQYFRTSFRFSETDTKETSIDLSHLDCHLSAIEKVVQSLYNNQIDITQENLANILRIADYLMYNDLLQALEDFMIETLEISNAAFYFQLCLQYGFDKGHLFTSVSVLLSSRFHDYLIHQPSSLDWSVDLMELMLSYNLFDHCTPLQMAKFISMKLEKLARHNHVYEKDELGVMSLAIVNFLEMYFSQLDENTLSKWSLRVNQYFDSWILSNASQISNLKGIETGLIKIQTTILDRRGPLSMKPECVPGQNEGICQNSLSTSSSLPGMSPSLSDGTHPDGNVSNEKHERPVNESSSSSTNSEFQHSENIPSSYPSVHSNNDKPVHLPSHTEVPPGHESPSVSPNIHHRDSTSPDLCDCLVVLSPSPEMVSQLMEVEARRAKPLLRAPQFSLHVYDIGYCMWRAVGILDFPVQGHMLEKHAWRMAFVHNSLFLFSLSKRKGLEYNIIEKQWQELSCENIFKAHSPFRENNEEADHSDTCFPVKSVIPISIEGRLVVLSMSREPRQDNSFWTQQHIYQWEPQTRSFKHVTFVQDARINLPATKWTVEGHDLVTVKASTMMFGDLHMYNVQHVHVYNAESLVLETHHIECPMKSGLKIFLRKKKLYLLNFFGEYRVYDLASRHLSDWNKVSDLSPYLNCGAPDLEITYPAGIRTSCHAGNSRWTLNSNFNVWSASLLELVITNSEEFLQKCHPNPPFQYMTTMCSARLDTGLVASLDQAVFQMPPAMHNQ